MLRWISVVARKAMEKAKLLCPALAPTRAIRATLRVSRVSSGMFRGFRHGYTCFFCARRPWTWRRSDGHDLINLVLLFTRAESSIHTETFEESRTALNYQHILAALNVMFTRIFSLVLLCVSERWIPNANCNSVMLWNDAADGKL